jgi:phosphoadenosine phosphosulfate reductase
MAPGPARLPGLDRAALLALRRPRHDREAITSRIRRHLEENDGYVAFSGGKDSLIVLDIARAAEPNVPVAFFDSGFEFPETYRYLSELIGNWGLARQFHWISARQTTLEVLHATAAWDHHRSAPARRADLRDILITEPASRAHQAHGPGELWGVRAQESRGRAALYAQALRAETAARCNPACCPGGVRARRGSHGGVIRRTDGTVAYGPVWNWTADDVWAYIARRRLPVNPVYAKLRRLGAPEHFLRVSHMLDGGRLEHGRVTWLRRGWPSLFDELACVLPRIREYV